MAARKKTFSDRLRGALIGAGFGRDCFSTVCAPGGTHAMHRRFDREVNADPPTHVISGLFNCLDKAGLDHAICRLLD